MINILYEKTSPGKSNFFIVSGSFITLISLVMPWYHIPLMISSFTVSALGETAGHLFENRTAPFHAVATTCYMLAISLLAPFFNKKFAALLALAGILSLTITLYLNAIPVENFTWGIAVTASGLILILTGFLSK